MYLIIDEKTKEAAIVDPVEPKKVCGILLLVITFVYVENCSQFQPAAITAFIQLFQVLKAVEQEGVQLKSALTTHHHWYVIILWRI
jgi:glyoxylase-like metal-dependent hydrolase (beta-lactamase superfamily II)